MERGPQVSGRALPELGAGPGAAGMIPPNSLLPMAPWGSLKQALSGADTRGGGVKPRWGWGLCPRHARGFIFTFYLML